MHCFCLAALLCLTSLVAVGSAFSTYESVRIQAQARARAARFTYSGPRVPSYNISIPIDHFDTSNEQTYLNRYWVNDTYYEAGGPVFFYDVGEGGATNQLAAMNLAEVNQISAIMRLAERYHGLAIMWEHRYFGESLPVALNLSTHEPKDRFAGYRYLTVDQALEDVVYFANHFCPDGYSTGTCDGLSPSETPWIWLGGSYPGVRGALLRIRNPEIFYAVWSSSAPLQAMVDGSPYFDPIHAALPSNCSNDILEAIKYADEVMSGNHGEQAYKDFQRLVYVAQVTEGNLDEKYNLTEASLGDQYDIATTMVKAISSDFQSSGPPITTELFCDHIQSFNPNGIPGNTSDPYIAILSNPGDGNITDSGIAATYNSSTALDAYMYAWRSFEEEYFERIVDRPPTELPRDHGADRAGWNYLVFSVFGWDQAANPDNITLVSRFDNLTISYERLAQSIWVDIVEDDFGGPPNVTELNKYGGWSAQTSNVMFTVGEFDPWRGGSVLSESTYIGAPTRVITQDVPQCGQPPNGTDVFGVVFPGAVHVQDLHTLPNGKSYDGTESMAIALPLFQSALDKWLPCFSASRS